MWIDDDILACCAEPVALATFVPVAPMIVLGAANDEATEVDLATAKSDGVAVLRRYGGGGTVVLHGGCTVVSLGLWVRQPFQNRFYFELVNSAVIDALSSAWPPLSVLSQRGLSDLVHGHLKVGGTSLFRSRHYLLYQASLLVEPRVELIERYLQHPSREPDYRQGRAHRSFLCGLNDLVAGLESKAVAQALQAHLPAALRGRLGAELVAPIPAEQPGLLGRIGRT